MMKILLVAPGPYWSTHDIYKYYLDAMHSNKDVQVQGFSFHNMMYYHKVAMDKAFPHYSLDERDQVVAVRAARELILDAIYFKPDVIFFIAGTLIPPEIYNELLHVRRELDRAFATVLYFTECPYTDDVQDYFFKYGDALFVNDLYSVKRYDPTGTKYVEYLPHSFNPKIHRPGNENDVKDEGYNSDVFFGATVFKERLDLVSSVDWNGINLKLQGGWKEWDDTPEGQSLMKYVVDDKTYASNSEYAKYYRGTKIALNVHRTRSDIDGIAEPLDNYSDAYSIGPRIYEAVACGAFLLTDFRQEAYDIFGDTIEYFETSDDLEEKVKYWLDPEHEQERINRSVAAKEKIQNCTFSDRLENNILPVLDEVLKLRRVKHG